MNTTIRAVAVAALLGFAAAPALAQPAAPDPALAQPAIARMPAKAKLAVTTPAFKDGGDMPFENTQYRGNIFPGLAWTKGPKATRSYALIMQDTDRMTPTGPLVHWTMFTIPATVTKLEAGMTAPPPGASFGPNYKGANQAYLGPHTPAGPKHHYHFQVFALDATLADPGPSYDALTSSMKGHILASGEVVGLAQIDPTAPPPAPRPAAPPPE